MLSRTWASLSSAFARQSRGTSSDDIAPSPPHSPRLSGTDSGAAVSTSVSMGSSAATKRALAVPEILEAIGWHLDQTSLLSCTKVARSWRETLEPVFWYLVEIETFDSIDLWEGSLMTTLESKMHLVRTLVLTETVVDSTTTTSCQQPATTLGSIFTPFSTSITAASVNTSSTAIHNPFILTVYRILQLGNNTQLKSLTVRPAQDDMIQLDFSQPGGGGGGGGGIVGGVGPLSRLSSLTRLNLDMLDNTMGTFKVEQIFDTCPELESLIVNCTQSSFVWTVPNNINSGQEDYDSDSAPSTFIPFDATKHTHPQRQRRSKLNLKRLEIRGLQWPVQSFLQLIRRCPNLVSLTLAGQSKAPWDWTVSAVKIFAQACPELHEIHIDPRYGAYFAESLSVEILTLFPNLTKFSIPHCDFGSETAFEVLKTKIHQMEELNVAYTRKPGMSNAMLVELMCGAYKLRRLNASGISLDPWHFNILPPSRLDGDEEEEEMIITSPMERPWVCRGLQVLVIGFMTLHANTRLCHSIYHNLARLTELEQIRILPNHFPIHFEAGLQELSSLKRLEKFDAHGTDGQEIDQEVIQWMGRAWPRLRTLRVFFRGNAQQQSLMTRSMMITTINSSSSSSTTDQDYRRVRQWLHQIGRGDVEVQMY